MLTPALNYQLNTKVVRRRELTVSGQPLVKTGEQVSADQIVLKAEVPGDLRIYKLAEKSGLLPEQTGKNLQVKVGDQISAGQLLYAHKSFLNLFSTEVVAEETGVVEYYLPENGHLAIRAAASPISKLAFISGKVVEVDSLQVTIETRASLMQGIFGVGGERSAQFLKLPLGAEDRLEFSRVGDLPLKDKIIAGGVAPQIEDLNALAAAGIRGLITSCITSATLEQFLGFRLGLPITGGEDVPFTLILTEGFGSDIPLSKKHLRFFELANGLGASINGATQIRAGAVRPELIISDTPVSAEQAEQAVVGLELGSQVKIITAPYFAQTAEVVALPKQPERIATGSLSRVVHLKLQNGQTVVMSRSNIEL